MLLIMFVMYLLFSESACSVSSVYVTFCHDLAAFAKCNMLGLFFYYITVLFNVKVKFSLFLFLFFNGFTKFIVPNPSHMIIIFSLFALLVMSAD